MSIHEIPLGEQWKIVSGSFIHSPISAVKELIDNSIDAGAKTIFIEVDSKTGGCEYIAVRDDGSGVPEEDRTLMCLNHTTSKITTIDDLDTVDTMGFRGEALFMLAQLSTEKGSMEIITRTKDEKVGKKWFVDRSGSIKEHSMKASPNPYGTTVIIKRLLHGLRARYIEMSARGKKNVEDLRYLINHYSLLYREVRFNFTLVALNKNGFVSQKQLQQTLDTKLPRVRALSVLTHLRKPSDVNFIMVTDLVVNNYLKLNLILPTMSPYSDVVNTKVPFKFLSVNRRPMSPHLWIGKEFSKLLKGIYKELQIFEPSIWFVDIECSGVIIDVNIEPEKNDILMKNSDIMFKEMKGAIKNLLIEKLQIPVDEEETGDEARETTEKTVDIEDPMTSRGQVEISRGHEEVATEVTPNETIGFKIAAPITQSSKSISPEYMEDNTTLTELDKVSDVPDHDGHIEKSNINEMNLTPDNTSSTSLENVKDTDSSSSEGPPALDEDDWSRNLMDEPPTFNERVEGVSSSGRSVSQPSLSMLPAGENGLNEQSEDIEISKDISLSNPFILSKMRRISKKIENTDKGARLNLPKMAKTTDYEDVTPPELKKRRCSPNDAGAFTKDTAMFTTSGKRKVPQAEKENLAAFQGQQIPSQETQKKNEGREANTRVPPPLPPVTRLLESFTEYTNTLSLTLDYHTSSVHKSSQDNYPKPSDGINRPSIKVEDYLSDKLTEPLHGNAYRYKKLHSGWFLFTRES